MGDVVHSSVLLKGGPPDVTTEEIVSYIKRTLPDYFSKVRPEFQVKFVSTRDDRSPFFILSGINLELNEIRRGLSHHQLRDYHVYVKTPDFGCARDSTGFLKDDASVELHGRLRASQGFLPVIDVFMDQFLKLFGNIEYMDQKIYFDSVKAEINADKLMMCGFRIQYGQVPDKIDSADSYNDKFKGRSMKNDMGGMGVTEIEYMFTSEALQAICMFNKQKNFCSGEKQFITFNDAEKRCDFPGITGLGLNSTKLHIARYIRSHKYLPLEELNPLVFSLTKIRSLESTCFACSKSYKILGIGPDLNWFAGICGCDTFESPFTWPNENFFRLYLPYRKLRIHNRKSNGEINVPCDSKNDKLGLEKFSRGILPCYKNVTEFKKTALASHIAEVLYEKKQYSKQQTSGILLSAESIEVVPIKQIPTVRYVLKFQVNKTSLWCSEGSSDFKTVKLKQIATASNKDLSPRAIKANVCYIKDNDCEEKSAQVTVVVVALMKPEESLRIGSVFNIAPEPISSIHQAIKQSTRKWEQYEHDMGFNQSDIPVQIVRVKQEFAQTRDYSLWKCRMSVINSKMWQAVSAALQSCYVGCDVLIDLCAKENTSHQDVDQKVTGRISKVGLKTDTGERLTVDMYVMMNKQRSRQQLSPIKCTLKLWALFARQVLDEASEFVPGGAETIYEDYDMMLEDEEEDLVDNSEIVDKSLNVAVRKLLDFDPHLVKMYDTKKLVVPHLSSLDAILSGWKDRPVTTYPLIDFLNQPYNCSTQIISINRSKHDIPPLKQKFLKLQSLLDPSQKNTVTQMLGNIIHATRGPPGTGKTFTGVIGAAMVHCQEEGLIVYCVPTNEGVDNAYEAMLGLNRQYNLNMQVVRMQSHTRERSGEYDKDPNQLHVKIKQHPMWNQFDDINRIEQKIKTKGEEYLTRQESSNFKSHYLNIACQVLMSTDIVFCTVPCAMNFRMGFCLSKLQRRGRMLSAVIVDEASLLSVCHMVALFTKNPQRFWMLGDDKQLGMIVKSGTAETACYGISYMELMSLSDSMKVNNVFKQLDTNYRMPKCSANMISEFMYDGTLHSSPDVNNRKYKLNDIVKAFPEVGRVNIVFFTYPVIVETKMEGSYFNPTEVSITLDILRRLVESNTDMSRVCVLSFYEKQVRQLEEAIEVSNKNYEPVKVSTTDAFQGKQRDIVILSMVRSGTRRVGFLKDKKRLNVAFSRHSHFLFVVADVKSLYSSEDQSLQSLFKIHAGMKTNVVRYKVISIGSNDGGTTTKLTTYLLV